MDGLQKTAIAVTLSIFLVAAMISCMSSKKTPDTITLGYCPTMTPYAQHVAADNPDITPVRYASTAEALHALCTGTIQAALIGRRARSAEIDTSTSERYLKEGYTLVANRPRSIDAGALGTLTIHTALPKEKVSKLVPENPQVIFHATQERALAEGLDESVLIDWRDFKDSYGLVISTTSGGAKDPRFRTPMLYCRSCDDATFDRIARSVQGHH